MTYTPDTISFTLLLRSTADDTATVERILAEAERDAERLAG